MPMFRAEPMVVPKSVLALPATKVLSDGCVPKLPHHSAKPALHKCIKEKIMTSPLRTADMEIAGLQSRLSFHLQIMQMMQPSKLEA